jgi:hypothetical protein
VVHRQVMIVSMTAPTGDTPGQTTHAFPTLSLADLVVDAVYEGGVSGNVSDDPLGRLLPCGNQGGFRYKKGLDKDPLFVVLYSDLADPDWPDVLDVELGRFTYWGDNKRAGQQLAATKRGGNQILQTMFDRLHGAVEERRRIPPFFIFTKGAKGRDVVFRGLAVPGAPGVTANDDLVAVWRTGEAGKRFQNYRALFSVLDVPVVTRAWIEDLLAGIRNGSHAPDAWARWRAGKTATLLTAPASLTARSRAQQLPDESDRPMIEAITGHFGSPTDFEACAARIWEMQAGRVEYTLTRPSRDGGRDAFGTVRVGPESDPVRLEFALEAKRYAFEHAVTVRDLARLISRIRNRMFGVLVTTSFLNPQAYEEFKSDGHPIVVIAARDIVDILKSNGYGDVDSVRAWLTREFPSSTPKEPADQALTA